MSDQPIKVEFYPVEGRLIRVGYIESLESHGAEQAKAIAELALKVHDLESQLNLKARFSFDQVCRKNVELESKLAQSEASVVGTRAALEDAMGLIIRHHAMGALDKFTAGSVCPVCGPEGHNNMHAALSHTVGKALLERMEGLEKVIEVARLTVDEKTSYHYALNEAIKALDRAKDEPKEGEMSKKLEWISVKNSLPEVGSIAALLCSADGHSWMCVSRRVRSDSATYWEALEARHVTYWMVLPEPPTREPTQ